MVRTKNNPRNNVEASNANQDQMREDFPPPAMNQQQGFAIHTDDAPITRKEL